MRMHPIHKKWTGHKGVDYAAPSGTPIHATADGTVEFIGRQNGYGNVIILKNFGKYSTLYAHQSRFAKGLKKGDRVQQGQLIGYVGSTGWATGPHLHYEFRINKQPVDPLSVDLPVARTLETADRKAFQAVVARYQPQIKLMARLQDSRIQARPGIRRAAAWPPIRVDRALHRPDVGHQHGWRGRRAGGSGRRHDPGAGQRQPGTARRAAP